MAAAPVITVDGPSGAGKGTIAHMLADTLGWRFLDSGALYRVTGRPQRAIDEYAWIIKQHPRAFEAWLGMAAAQAQNGALNNAERAYRTAIGIRPEEAQGYHRYADHLLQQGRWRDLQVVGRRLIQLNRG